MAEVKKPRIVYRSPPTNPLGLGPGGPEGWLVVFPDEPGAYLPCDSWPQALQYVARWYETAEQRRRVQGKIAELVDKMKT